MIWSFFWGTLFGSLLTQLIISEIGGTFQGDHKVSTSRTPTRKSIDKVLFDIMMNCNPYWDSLGVKCTDTYGLMMGCASVTFRTSPEKYSPELVKRIKTDVQRLMVRGVRYYKRRTNIHGHRIVSRITHAA
jgi:hypothetical protein